MGTAGPQDSRITNAIKHGMRPKDLNNREFRTMDPNRGQEGFGFRGGYPKASGMQICVT